MASYYSVFMRISDLECSTLEQVSEVVFTSHMESKLATYDECEELDRYRNQYYGQSKIQLPVVSGSGGFLRFTYKVESSAMEGSVSTPLFGKPFDEKSFKLILALTVYINVPKGIEKNTNMSIVINIDYDVAEFGYNEFLSISSHNYGENGKTSTGEVAFEHLDKTKKKARRTYIVRDDFFKVKYNRRIDIKGRVIHSRSSCAIKTQLKAPN